MARTKKRNDDDDDAEEKETTERETGTSGGGSSGEKRKKRQQQRRPAATSKATAARRPPAHPLLPFSPTAAEASPHSVPAAPVSSDVADPPPPGANDDKKRRRRQKAGGEERGGGEGGGGESGGGASGGSSSERRVCAGLEECRAWVRRPHGETLEERCAAYGPARRAADRTLRFLLGRGQLPQQPPLQHPSQPLLPFPPLVVFRGLLDQLARSATSVPANLSEGDGRANGTQRVTFAKIARGSLVESLDHLASLASLDAFFPEAWPEERRAVAEEWAAALRAMDDWLDAEIALVVERRGST